MADSTFNDLAGKEVRVGDIFVFPSGSPRYGGLTLEIGIVVKKTSSRISTISTKLVNKSDPKFKTSSRTTSKILVVTDAVLDLPGYSSTYRTRKSIFIWLKHLKKEDVLRRRPLLVKASTPSTNPLAVQVELLRDTKRSTVVKEEPSTVLRSYARVLVVVCNRNL